MLRLRPAIIKNATVILCAVIAGYFALRNAVFLVSASKFIYKLPDFNHYYAGGHFFLLGQDPYIQNFSAWGGGFIWHPGINSATNPPLLVIMLAPLAMLPPYASWLVWEFLVLASAVGAFLILLRIIGGGISPAVRITLWLMYLGSMPVLSCLLFSQVQSLVLLLVVSGWYCFRNNHSYRAALFWGIATSLKFYTWPLLLLLFVVGRWRAGLIGVVLVFSSLCYVMGSTVNLGASFMKSALPTLAGWAVASTENVSIATDAAFLLFGGQYSSSSLLLAALSGGLGICIVLVSGRACKDGALLGTDAAVCLVATCSFLQGPVAWTSYLIVLSLPMVLVAALTKSRFDLAFLWLLWLVFLVLGDKAVLPFGLPVDSLVVLPNPFSLSINPNAYSIKWVKFLVEILPSLFVLWLGFLVCALARGRSKPVNE